MVNHEDWVFGPFNYEAAVAGDLVRFRAVSVDTIVDFGMHQFNVRVDVVLGDTTVEDEIKYFMHCTRDCRKIYDLLSRDFMSRRMRGPCICRGKLFAFQTSSLCYTIDSVPAWWFDYISVVEELTEPLSRTISLSDALSQPMRHARETAAKCAGCRQLDVWHILEATKVFLRDEIEIRLSEVR